MRIRHTTSVARRSTLVALLVTLAGAACASSSSPSTIGEGGPAPLNAMKSQRYLFPYFEGNGEDGLHLAYSEDGYAWRALKEDKPFFHPSVGKEKLTRDPSIVRGPDVSVANNILHANAPASIVWDGTGTGNTFTGNVCNRSQPNGLCTS